MEVKWLEDFLSLADARSFSIAARERHVTQSAFSRRIQSLEAWMGTQLVNRQVSPIGLTPAGALFRSYAAEILRNVYAARTLVNGQRDEVRDAGTVQFSVAHTLVFTFFPEWLRLLNRDYGPIQPRVAAINVPEGVVQLMEGRCDLLLSFHHPQLPILLDPKRFPFVTLGVERISPFSASDGRGQPMFRLPGNAESPLPFMAYATGAFLGNVVEMLMLNAPQVCALRRSFETHMSEALKTMVVAGHGVGWLPESCIQREIADGSLVRAGSDAWTTALEVRLYRSNEHTGRAGSLLWDWINHRMAGGHPPTLAFPVADSAARAGSLQTPQALAAGA